MKARSRFTRVVWVLAALMAGSGWVGAQSGDRLPIHLVYVNHVEVESVIDPACPPADRTVCITTEQRYQSTASWLDWEIAEAEAAGEYERCLRQIGDLAEVLDRFFVEVLVMDENLELRQNRIGLLQSIQRMISRTARLTEVVVDKSEHRDRTATGN